jgi:hypothetical protein
MTSWCGNSHSARLAGMVPMLCWTNQLTSHQEDFAMKKILIALMMSCVGSTAFAANFVTEAPKLNELVDTGWQCTDNATNHKLVMKHGLGSTPRFYTLYFSDTADSSVVYPLDWSWGTDASGNPVTIAISTEAIILNIFSGAPLHGIWDANNGQWSKFTSGCFRAFVVK